MTTRNQAFAALFALTANMVIDGGSGHFVTRSRKFKHFAKVPSDSQPAFFQTEHSESEHKTTSMPAIRRWHGSWVVYLSSDPENDADVPTSRVNDILDAFEAVLSDPFQKQTLGGLVEHVYIDGTIMKVPGDDDGQGMIVVPLTILVP